MNHPKFEHCAGHVIKKETGTRLYWLKLDDVYDKLGAVAVRRDQLWDEDCDLQCCAVRVLK